MANHVHLVIDPGNQPGNLSFLMKRIACRQTCYINTMEKRSGSQERSFQIQANECQRISACLLPICGTQSCTVRAQDREWNLIREAAQRRQLTGNKKFEDEISKKLNRRIELRGQGRQKKEK